MANKTTKETKKSTTTRAVKSRKKTSTSEKKATKSRVKKVQNEVLAEDTFVPENKVEKKKDKKDTKFFLIGFITLIFVLAIVIAVLVSKKDTHTSRPANEKVLSQKELMEKLQIDIKDPESSNDIQYAIENDTIAKVSYKKVTSDGDEMNFVMRTSSSTEDIENSIGLDIEFPEYNPIMMNVICSDGTEVPVEAKVALDEENDKKYKYMKALWYDNDKYYSMVTDNLTTREEFLQEVNRVIIANHIPF